MILINVDAYWHNPVILMKGMLINNDWQNSISDMSMKNIETKAVFKDKNDHWIKHLSYSK